MTVLGSSAPVAGLAEYEGPLFSANDVQVGALPVSVRSVACIGTDRAMVALLPALVASGKTVKVFEDRARLVLPAGIGFPRGGTGTRIVADFFTQCSRLLAVTTGHRILSLPLDIGVSHLQELSGRLHRRRRIRDPWIRRQMKPWPHDSRPVLVDSGYYGALTHRNCQLISWPIASASKSGIRTCDGIEHRVDAIITAQALPLGPSPTFDP